jgi:DNA polymerase III epsilon subunit-like protein
MIYPKNYVVFDLETSGLKPNEDCILEIGAIKIVEGEEDREFHIYLDWGIEIPEYITAINKIDNVTIAKEGLAPEVGLTYFCNFIDGYPLIGHNIVKFDLPFLFNAFTRLKMPVVTDMMEKKSIDTAARFKARTLNAERYWYETEYEFALRILEMRKFGMKYNVAACCLELGIPNEVGQHEARKDVILTAQIYQRLCLKS